jgi:ribonuclease HII
VIERTWWCEGYTRIAGVDEAGRGALFGPVVAAAVVFRPGWDPSRTPGIRDSKLLSAGRREELFAAIVSEAADVAAGFASASVIDEMGIVAATVKAMSDALAGLRSSPDLAIVDGIGPLPPGRPGCAAIDADALCLSVAAASIIAKVTRDHMIIALAAAFPGYLLERNLGYGTMEHLGALARLGPTPLHRRSFAAGYPAASDEESGPGSCRE